MRAFIFAITLSALPAHAANDDARAALTVKLVQNGTKTAGNVIVFDANHVEVAKGTAGTAINVPVKQKLRVVGRLDREGGKLVQGEVYVTLKPQTAQEATIDIGDGELIVDVTENGRKAAAVISLWEPGASQAHRELPQGEVTSVPSGTWELRTQLQGSHDFKELRAQGVIVVLGKKTAKTINHSTHSVTLSTSLPKPKDGEAHGVLIELFQQGVEQPFNQLDPDTTARLSSGRYEVQATHEARTLDDGTHPRVRQALSVPGASRLVLTPQEAMVDVTTTVGGKARALPVAFFQDDAQEAFVERTTPEDGKTSITVSPRKLRVTATLTGGNGAFVAEKIVDAKHGSARVVLDVNKGGVVHQVEEAGAAVPASVRYLLVAKVKKGAPEPEPVVVKAGETAWLDPGSYDVSVDKGGETRTFPAVKIERGALLEATLTWAPNP